MSSYFHYLHVVIAPHKAVKPQQAIIILIWQVSSCYYRYVDLRCYLHFSAWFPPARVTYYVSERMSSVETHQESVLLRRCCCCCLTFGYGFTEEDDGHPHDVYPAVLKPAMRAHIQKLCQSPHCVDSLVFYMNSPAYSDGASLLWDTNQDGVVSVNSGDGVKGTVLRHPPPHLRRCFRTCR